MLLRDPSTVVLLPLVRSCMVLFRKPPTWSTLLHTYPRHATEKLPIVQMGHHAAASASKSHQSWSSTCTAKHANRSVDLTATTRPVGGGQSGTAAADAITAILQHWPWCCQHALHPASLAHAMFEDCPASFSLPGPSATTKVRGSPLSLLLSFFLFQLRIPRSLFTQVTLTTCPS